jgi:hypothetical protein
VDDVIAVLIFGSRNLRTWHRYATPDGCPICQSIRSTGQPEDTLIALEASWATAPTQAPLPGYVCLMGRPTGRRSSAGSGDAEEHR